jgi:hypothetical protein
MNDMSQPPTPPNHPSVPPASGYNAPTPSYGAPQGGNYYPGAQNDKTNVLAIVSLVSAFVISLVAIITGHMALGQIKRTGEKGRGLAIAGLVLGYLGIVSGIIVSIVLVIMLVAGVGIFAAAAGSAYDDYDDYSSTSDPYSTDAPGLTGQDLTFEDGASLTSSSFTQFTDPFLGDSDWPVATPDDGNGVWSYNDPSGLCTVEFHQTALESNLVVAGDDRATTDAVLATVLGATPADLSSRLSDDTFATGYSNDGSVADTRMLSITKDDGTSAIFAGRAFAAVPSALYVSVACGAGGDAQGVYDEVKTTASIVVD